MNKTKKLAVSAMLCALTVCLSGFSIPVGASKCFPIQHMVNVLAAVLLGPWWGVLIAFCASLIRNLMGTGTFLAFPGSMVGALLCGLVYQKTKKKIPTYIAEVFGTGVLGGLLAWPVAVYLMGREAALFAYVLPFLVSTTGGTLIAALLIAVLEKTHAMAHLKGMLA
ncbi:MAG TPA: energy coupling factor transporter S component ThiW [Lachnospiraceae bacterium]|jgi:energy coupling factor transporter S component ThiW|nr:energy coupling factor transporter S component ThiW [Lachnospiraceae bacterium]